MSLILDALKKSEREREENVFYAPSGARVLKDFTRENE